MDPVDAPVSHGMPSTLRHFAILFVPLALFVLIGGGAYLNADRSARVEAVMARESARVGREAEVMAAIIEARGADAAFLAEHITDMLQEPGEFGLDRIARLLWTFAGQKQWYVQVRFLDVRGREAVRLDIGPDGPRRVQGRVLRDESGTAFFEKGSGLPFGQVHVSRFELDAAHGRIEEPWRPLLRFSSPVRGPDGVFAGLVVLDMDGRILLDRLRQAAVAALGRPLLVNGQGYWLLAPSPDLEWPFQVRDGREGTLEASWPGVWDRIRTGGAGQFFHDGALYTSSTVMAGDPGWLKSATARLADEDWVIVARVAPEDMRPPLGTVFVVLTVALFVVMGGVSWIWASGRARREAVQARLAASEEKFRAMSEASRDALAMIDDQGRVVFWNPAAEGMFGLSREEMLGRVLHDAVAPPGELDKARAGFPEFAAGGRGKVVGTITELTARRGDGSVFPVELSVAGFRQAGRWWAVGAARDISERKQTEALLVRLATTDGLTGLFNRRRFMEAGEAELGRAGRFGHVTSLIMFDVDHFKAVNDTMGHAAGDAVLASLARTARETLRAVDILGRIGGEEFAALLPETGIEEALGVAERLRAAVAAAVAEFEGSRLAVTVSLGAAECAGSGESLDSLLGRADAALYRAKQAGRNRAERG